MPKARLYSVEDKKALLGLILRIPLDVLLEQLWHMYAKLYNKEEKAVKERVGEILRHAVEELRKIQ